MDTKNKLPIILLTALLIMLSLACQALQGTSEAPDTPVPATSTSETVAPTATDAPTEAPTATPVPETETETEPDPTPTAVTKPKPQGITLEILNDSNRDIWSLYISPSDADTWGDEWLQGTIIAAGDAYIVEGIAEGIYDVQVRDADDQVIQTRWDWDISGASTWSVAAEVTLDIYNNAGVPIAVLYMTSTDEDSWGSNLLEGEAIPVDGTYILEGFSVGSYDIRVEDAEENLIEVMYNIWLDGDYTWTVNGKSSLPDNAMLRFEDAFDDNRNNWGGTESADVIYHPAADGQYCIDIISPDLTAWEWYEPYRPDAFIAEVACTLDTTTDASCGLGFGPDGDNLYWFEVSPSDQTYALFMLKDDAWQDPLIGWTESKNIAPGGWNYLSLERVNGILSVFINGILQGQVEGSDFSTGRIGLGGSTYNDGNVTVCLDDLRVWRLE